MIHVVFTGSTKANGSPNLSMARSRGLFGHRGIQGNTPPHTHTHNPSDAAHFHRFQHFFLLCTQNLAPLSFFSFFFTPPAFSLLHLEHHTWTHTPCLSLSPLSILWWCVHQIKQFWGGWIGPWKEWVGRGLEGCAVFAVMAHPPGQRRLLLCTL